jgi:hypothetical protein
MLMTLENGKRVLTQEFEQDKDRTYKHVTANTDQIFPEDSARLEVVPEVR